MTFTDRQHAGRVLAHKLEAYADRDDVVVLGLPRGGVVVAAEVAAHLQAPLDVFVVRKLGVPWNPEFAMGAIASGGAKVLDRRVVDRLGISQEEVDQVVTEEERELAHRERIYRADHPAVPLRNRLVVLVDDGLATGSTMLAAVKALRHHQVAQLVAAVPVAPQDTCQALALEVDDMICAETPADFTSVGSWYRDFGQTSHEEVRELLRQDRERRHAA